MRIWSKNLSVFLVIAAAIFAMTLPVFVSAQNGSGDPGFILLAPDVVPNYTPGQGIGPYVQGIFNLGIGIASALAVIMIVIGGVQYMLTGSVTKKGQAKETISSAILGLVLALAAFTILQTINEDLVKFDLVKTIKALGDKARIESGLAPSAEQSSIEQQTRDRLTSGGIVISNQCPPGRNLGCTNVGDLPDSAVQGLIGLANTCGCSVVVTGGTEDGHQTHGQGQPIVDLRPTTSLNNFLLGSGGSTNRLSCGDTVRRTGALYVWEPPGCRGSTGNHWHVIFG